jgi:hypothetical protein
LKSGKERAVEAASGLRRHGGTLVTGDADFDGLPGTVVIR